MKSHQETLPPDPRETISGLDLAIVCVPYVNLLVSASLLSQQTTRKRGAILMALSLVTTGLCSLSGRMLIPDPLTLHPEQSWLIRLLNLPVFWGGLITLIFVTALAGRLFKSRKIARTWQELALQTGLHYQPGGWFGFSGRARVAGKLHQRELSLSTQAPMLIDNVLDETCLTVSISNPSSLAMRLDYMPAWRLLNTWIGGPDRVRIGDPAFDAAFSITSKQPQLVKNLFASADLRRRLYRLREYATVQIESDTISLKQTGREGDAVYLQYCLYLLLDIAALIDQAGNLHALSEDKGHVHLTG